MLLASEEQLPCSLRPPYAHMHSRQAPRFSMPNWQSCTLRPVQQAVHQASRVCTHSLQPSAPDGDPAASQEDLTSRSRDCGMLD